ncbi:globin-like protein [Exophiala viscosa]|uniref:globin-like protein n=1 Tax=Exophiala viscosa TaxID=2486360 RepID=UPI0021963470|nr:globin-like protein [Exophiala viscosa]
MPLTEEQAQVIISTVPVLQQYGNQITTVFYANMLREVPDLNNVFNTSNQRNGHQQQALAGTLYAYAANINNLEVLGPAVERICHKHASLYIRPEHYDIVGKYLLEAMGEVLGNALTPQILDAWAAAYKQIADIMINREDELMKHTNGWTEWKDFRLDRKVPESDEVTSFYLKPLDGKPLPEFLPGQYISIQIDVPALKYKQARQYSLSDKYSPEYYRISVKREKGLDISDPSAVTHPGYVSNILHDEKKQGDIVELSHPAGDFFLDVRNEGDKDSPIVLLSAGVGLTPLMSILNTLVEKNGSQKISWVHGSRNSSSDPFAQYVKSIMDAHPEVSERIFHSMPHDSEKEGVDYDIKGRLNLSRLRPEEDLRLNEKNASYYICGPENFMTDLEQALRDRGVDASRINMELFGTGGVPR